MDKEKYIKISPESVTYEGTEKILKQMNKCVCKIYSKDEGTWFFTKIPFNNILLPVLITNNHVLSQNDIKNDCTIKLSLNYDKKKKRIKIEEDRKTYTNEELDITIIEIKENKDNINNEYIDLDDDIIDYFRDNENVNDLNDKYSNKSIYILHYPKGNNIVVSYGQPPELDNKDIKHKCSTEHGSSGAPILLINNQKLIGVHCGNYKMEEYDKGTSIIYSIIEFQKKNINKENKNDNKIKGNYIICEDNITIRIINSYEGTRREKTWSSDIEKFHNKKENKENCLLDKISSKYLIKTITSYIKGINFIYKFLINSKGLQRKFNINLIDYKERYLEKRLKYEDFLKNIKKDYYNEDKTFLNNKLQKVLLQYQIDEKTFKKFASNYFIKYYKNIKKTNI